MAVKIKKIVIWRGEVENVPGALARTLAPLTGANLEIVMGYHRHGEGNQAVIEAYPIAGKRQATAAAGVGLQPAAMPALLVAGEDRPGLGHAIAQALGEAGININFTVAQVIKKRFSAVFGFSSAADAQRALGPIKRAAAEPRKTRKVKRVKRGKKAKKSGKK
jgi:hypothetical protein